MKKDIIFILIGAVIVVAAGVWYFSAATSTPPAESPSKTLTAQVTYTCNDNKTIQASFYKGEQIPVEPGQPPIPTGSVGLVLSDGRTFDLPQTISADGSRYANSDESFVFWSVGDNAIVLENNAEKDYKGCVVK